MAVSPIPCSPQCEPMKLMSSAEIVPFRSVDESNSTMGHETGLEALLNLSAELDRLQNVDESETNTAQSPIHDISASQFFSDMPILQSELSKISPNEVSPISALNFSMDPCDMEVSVEQIGKMDPYECIVVEPHRRAKTKRRLPKRDPFPEKFKLRCSACMVPPFTEISGLLQHFSIKHKGSRLQANCFISKDCPFVASGIIDALTHYNEHLDE